MVDRSAAHPLLSSSRQDWLTPNWFLDLVRSVGPIDLDPAAPMDNATGARSFYSRSWDCKSAGEWRGECGLSGAWTRSGLAFINPPYGGHLSGAVEPGYQLTKKCKACGGDGFVRGEPCEACSGGEYPGIRTGRILTGVGRGWANRIASDQGEWITLVPVRTETDWWRTLHTACDYALLWSSRKFGRRINFVDPSDGSQSRGSTLASTVFYRGPRGLEFLAAFSPHGRLIPGERFCPVLESS
jgi:hypothetical protein